MKIFTRMKHMMLLVAMCCASTAFAIDVTTSHAYTEADVPDATNGLTLSLDGITVKHGPASTKTDKEYTWSYQSNASVAGYTGYVSSSDNPRNDAGTGAGATVIPVGGAFVSYAPVYDGTIAAAVVANNGKSNFVLEVDGEGNIAVIPVTASTTPTLNDDGSFLFAEKYYGVLTFDVKAGYTYYLFTAGSKMSFYGFSYTYDDGYGIAWVQDFENEATYTDGWSINAGATAYWGTRSDGTHFLNTRNSNAKDHSSTYTLNGELFADVEEWRFEFDFAGFNCNHSTRFPYIKLSNSESDVLLNIAFTTSNGAPVNVTDVNGTVLGTFNCDDHDKSTRGNDIAVETWHHVLLEGTSTGIYLTVNAENGTGEIARVKVADSGYPATFELRHVSQMSQWAIDNLTLYVPGAKEGISTPSCSITGTYGNTRTITIVPGVGTEGTPAEATYYTTNGDNPTKESTKYTEPFSVSEDCTVKVISILPEVSGGAISEVFELDVKAGFPWPLNDDIVKISSLTGEGDFRRPSFINCYNNVGIVGNPEVTFSYTFNEEPITEPLMFTEDGILRATVSAEGYGDATEEIEIVKYAVTRNLDFAGMSQDFFMENYGESWAAITEGVRLANWSKSYTYYGTTLKGNFTFDNLLSCSGSENYPLHMIFGSGVGRATGSSYGIVGGVEGDIAVYEMNESLAPTSNFVQHTVLYMDDKNMTYAAGASQTIAKISIYRPVEELLTVTEGEDFAAVGGYNSATYTRTIAADAYGTICLPFTPDAASLENYTFFTMESAEDGVINFVEEAAPKANTPYIYCLKGENVAITGGATVVSATINDVTVNEGAWSMVGSFTNQSIDATTGKFYGLSSGKIVRATKTLNVKPYRAFFTSTTDASALALRITRGDETTEITAADLDVQPATVIYDLAGRRVEKMEKGIYIVNGKKVIR